MNYTNYSGSNRSGRERRPEYGSGFSGAGPGIWALLAGIGAGVAAMYFLDPNRGGRRRALVGNKVKSARHKLPRAVKVAARDLSNRAYGMWAETNSLISGREAADPVVEARIRSKMGRVISHPHAVHVTADNGRVTLDGVILKREVPALLKAAGKIPGVKTVENRMREYDSPEGISSLQGSERVEERSEFMQQHWSPAARLGAGAVGLGLGAAGAALLARSLSNTEFQRMFGFGVGRTAVTIEKSINVDAPPDVLYALWSNFENFPQFMSNVLDVEMVGDNRSHWTVAGPAGMPVEWDAEITRIVPDEMIAWRSVKGSSVANSGYVLFEPNTDGGTEVTVRISYSPPAGAVGHAVAKAFGADPKSEMDEDLMRMKSLLETGKLPHDAAKKIGDTQRSRIVH